jgi:hypothetical protein
MPAIEIDWVKLEAAFENHAPNVHAFLDRDTGEIHLLTVKSANPDELAPFEQDRQRYLRVEAVPSRDQYTMMESFIETVTFDPLKTLLNDAIVGKGAFRRFKDTVARHPDERKRWFAFRDVLLHQHILEWLENNQVEHAGDSTWNLQLPAPGEELPVQVEEDPGPEAAAGAGVQQEELRAYLQAWARAHGEDCRYLFGPAAFERLSEDLARAFSFIRRS